MAATKTEAQKVINKLIEDLGELNARVDADQSLTPLQISTEYDIVASDAVVSLAQVVSRLEERVSALAKAVDRGPLAGDGRNVR